MPYLRKTGTYTVLTAAGETRLVDEFEQVEPSRSAHQAPPGRKQLMLRSGEAVYLLREQTLQCVATGEQLTILSKE